MGQLSLTMVIFILLLLNSCSAQLHQREKGQAVVEQQKQQPEREPMPTITYRPG